MSTALNPGCYRDARPGGGKIIQAQNVLHKGEVKIDTRIVRGRVELDELVDNQPKQR